MHLCISNYRLCHDIFLFLKSSKQNVIIKTFIKTPVIICILLRKPAAPFFSNSSSDGKQKPLHNYMSLNDDVTPGVNVYSIIVSMPSYVGS